MIKALPATRDIATSHLCVPLSLCSWKARRHTFKWYQWLAVFLPCFEWIIGYDWRSNLLWDVLAGCSVGFMVVPQGMSYATLAGVPSVWGLYGSFIPVLMYSVFGSSRQLAVGPVAVTSLLIGNGIKKVVPGECEHWLEQSRQTKSSLAGLEEVTYICDRSRSEAHQLLWLCLQLAGQQPKVLLAQGTAYLTQLRRSPKLLVINMQ